MVTGCSGSPTATITSKATQQTKTVPATSTTTSTVTVTSTNTQTVTPTLTSMAEQPGTINVNAYKDACRWSGPFNFTVLIDQGPSGGIWSWSGESVPAQLSWQGGAATCTIIYNTNRTIILTWESITPSSTETLPLIPTTITPSSTQNLTPGDIITFTLHFLPNAT
jgi:hypothetical protein